MSSSDRAEVSQPQDDAAKNRESVVAALSAGDVDQIRIAARRFLQEAASPARAARFLRGAAEKAAPTELKPFRVGILSSFTIDMVHDPLIAHGLTEGLAVDIYQAGYDQYHQEILSPDSGLYRYEPDAILLAVDERRWAPEVYDNYLTEGIDQHTELAEMVVSRVRDLITTLRQHCNAPVLLHALSYPRHPSLGILDSTSESGQRQLIARINDGLAELARDAGAIYLVDVDAIVQTIGYASWYDSRLDFFARSPIARSAFDALARYYLRYLRALSGYSRKCLIVDLDNTLWGGIVGEDGIMGVQVGSEYPGNAFVAFQQAVRALRDRGVVLAIASKNNPADAEAVFTENPGMALTLDDFSAREIHWEPKSLSISRIAEKLNLGLRHMVFVDDNPAECAEVEQALPAVTVIRLPAQPEKMVDTLLADGLFDALQFSNEDARRAELYRQRDAAEKLRTEAGSLEDYYRSLEMKLHLTNVTADNLARASQMTQKTTQFNTTTRIYTEAELDTLRNDTQWKTLTMRVVDKFGDNGIVGLMLAKCDGDYYDIDTMLMSCRVINRGVETAMLRWLADLGRKEGARAIGGWILPTKRNVPVRDLFERHQFEIVQKRGDDVLWQLDLSEPKIDLPDWLEIQDTTEV